jgi:hypothetical protein
MKKILLFIALTGMLSCTSDSTEIIEPEPQKNFDVTLTPSSNFSIVDKAFTIKLSSTSEIHEIKQVFETGTFAVGGDGTNGVIDSRYKTLHYQLPDVGVETMNYVFTDIYGKQVTKSLDVNVTPAEAVQITGLKINSYYNIHGTYDEQYDENDPERLADILFAFSKAYSRNFSTEEARKNLWFLSDIYPNEEKLEFDLQDEQLFIAPYASFEVGIGDHDEGGMVEDLARDPSQMTVNLFLLQNERPSEIHIIKEDANVDITVLLKWPE